MNEKGSRGPHVTTGERLGRGLKRSAGLDGASRDYVPKYICTWLRREGKGKGLRISSRGWRREGNSSGGGECVRLVEKPAATSLTHNCNCSCGGLYVSRRRGLAGTYLTILCSSVPCCIVRRYGTAVHCWNPVGRLKILPGLGR